MFSRAKIASLVTLVALGVLAAVALASGSGGDPVAVQTQDDVATKPKVRTVIVRQTVHRRAKARTSPSAASSQSGHRSSGHAPAPAPAPAPAAAPPAAPAPVAPAPVAAVTVTDDHRGRGGDDGAYDDPGGDDAYDDHGGDDDSGHGRGRGRGGDDD